MKLKYIAILAVLTAFTANAEKFMYNGIWYETLDDTTCQTAAAENFEDLEFYPQQESEWYAFYGVRNKKTGNDVSYNLGSPNAYKNDPVIEIPEVVYDSKGFPYTVTRIGEFSFAGSSAVNTLKFPDTITEIGKGAFYLWQNLKNIDFGSGVSVIGEGAFCQCSGLNDLEIPANVKEIKEAAFMGCSSINNLTLNEGLTTIGKNAFRRCSAIKNELVIPNSVITIEDYAFWGCSSVHKLILGDNVEKIGKGAFYRVDHVTANTEDRFVIPATAMDIDENAFNFQNTNSTFTDIYYPNQYPDHINNNAFGLVGAEGVGLDYCDDYWIYLTVCLHVPVGTRELYKTLDGWKNFHCIIDDIVVASDPNQPDVVDPLNALWGYIYMIPGEEKDIYTELFDQEQPEDIFWVLTENEGEADIVDVTPEGHVTAKTFGNKIAIAYRNSNFTVDPSGNKNEVGNTMAGAVILFVCPTVTVVYDVNNTTTPTDGPKNIMQRKEGVNVLGENDSDPIVENEVIQLKNENLTYQHRVVYSSFPKVHVEPIGGIEIEEIDRAKVDENDQYVQAADGSTKENEFTPLQDEQLVGKDVETEDQGYIVPMNPVVENRVIAIYTTLSTDNDNSGTTGVGNVVGSSKVKVRVNGYNLTVEGADDASVVRVVDMNGRTVYESTTKSFRITDRGVYIVTVEDAAFKALVK